MKTNCWEFKKCGREPGGALVGLKGVCPAATALRVSGTNDGKNGGRACWCISDTLCDGKVQGAYATKIQLCVNCSFYQTVRKEQNASNNFKDSKDILVLLNNIKHK